MSANNFMARKLPRQLQQRPSLRSMAHPRTLRCQPAASNPNFEHTNVQPSSGGGSKQPPPPPRKAVSDDDEGDKEGKRGEDDYDPVASQFSDRLEWTSLKDDIREVSRFNWLVRGLFIVLLLMAWRENVRSKNVQPREAVRA
jgi:hypothetical protein